MGKRAFIPAWDGKSPVEGLTMVAPAPEPKVAAPEAATPPAAPEATAPATPADTKATPPAKSELPLPDLMAFAAVLLCRRLREMREEEEK